MWPNGLDWSAASTTHSNPSDFYSINCFSILHLGKASSAPKRPVHHVQRRDGEGRHHVESGWLYHMHLSGKAESARTVLNCSITCTERAVWSSIFGRLCSWRASIDCLADWEGVTKY